MNRQYSSLPIKALRPGVSLSRPERGFLRRISPDDPATAVMTDFMVLPAATVESSRSVREVNELMKLRGVRLLFIIDTQGAIVGLVTATDVLGEKPMQAARERNVRHDEVMVTDIMTSASMFEAIDYEDVLRSKVGHIAETLRSLGRQHVMVAEFARGTQTVRGLFSISQIARQLGVDLQVTGVASTFQEIEAALTGRN